MRCPVHRAKRCGGTSPCVALFLSSLLYYILWFLQEGNTKFCDVFLCAVFTPYTVRFQNIRPRQIAPDSAVPGGKGEETRTVRPHCCQSRSHLQIQQMNSKTVLTSRRSTPRQETPPGPEGPGGGIPTRSCMRGALSFLGLFLLLRRLRRVHIGHQLVSSNGLLAQQVQRDLVQQAPVL